MYYNSNDIDEVLHCSFCKARFADVIKLIPECGESICEKCYHEMKASSNEYSRFQCKLCRRSHLMPMSGLPDNKHLLVILKKKKIDKPLSMQAKKLKGFIAALSPQIAELKTLDGASLVNLFCEQMEQDVAISIDSAIKNLQETQKDIFAEIKGYRAQSLRGLRSRASLFEPEIETLARDACAFSAEWSENFTRVDVALSDPVIESALAEANEYRNKLLALRGKMIASAFNNKTVVFKAENSFINDKKYMRNFINVEFQEEKTSKELNISQVPSHTLVGHSKIVCSVTYLQDGRLASSSDDSTIKIWKADDGVMIFELKEHTDAVYALASLPKGLLASGSRDTTIKVWDLNDRKMIKNLRGHSQSVTSLKLLKSGRLASYSLDNTIKIWCMHSEVNNLLTTITGHGNTQWIIPFGMTSAGALFTASVSSPACKDNCVLRLWNPEEGKMILEIPTGQRGAWPVLVLSNDQLAVGFVNGSIMVFDSSNGAILRTNEKAHSCSVTALAQLPNKNLVSGGSDVDGVFYVSTVKIWTMPEFVLVQKILTQHNGDIFGFSVSPYGRQLASASKDMTIKVWQIK